MSSTQESLRDETLVEKVMEQRAELQPQEPNRLILGDPLKTPEGLRRVARLMSNFRNN